MLSPQESSRPVFFERLPEDKPSSTKPVSFVLAALVSLAIFVIINLSLRTYLDSYSPNFGSWVIHQKWELLLHLKETQDTLILGDSTANQGLVAEVIQEKTGLKTVNLGTIANLTLLNDVWMLNEYLQHHNPPKIVLIMNSYQMWSRDLNPQTLSNIPLLQIANPNSVFDPSPWNSELERIWQVALQLFPVYSESLSINSTLRSILQVPPDFNLVFTHLYSLSPLGTYSDKEVNPDKLDQDINENLGFLERQPVISEENQAALAALKNIANQYDFEIYLINAPLAEEVTGSPDFPRYFDVIESYLQDYFADSTHIHYVSGVKSYDREEMQRADHLLSDAAIDFTKYIVRTIFQ